MTESPQPTARHPYPVDDPLIELEGFGLSLGGRQILSNISFSVPKGSITALIGPSGSGKTALLRSFNRMNEWTDPVRMDGSLKFEGKDIHSSGTDLLGLRSRVGMVFRTPNAFSMSVLENVAYALRVQGKRHPEDGAEKILRRTGLWNLLKDRLSDRGDRLPSGLQQRLCVARALAASPALLLLDEPCSILDPVNTAELEDLLLSLGGEPTVVIVTHNPQQAARISQYTAFLSQGRLVEVGPTERVFQRPQRRETDDYISGRFG
ncbi:MAG: phosphate transporter ATP-binding protein [Fibrobacterota bacterium]|jgi:phosphate transport system ATP-binding protein